MRLMLITGEFPNPADSNKAIFNFNLVRALAQSHQVQVVCPIPWVDEIAARRAGRWNLSPDRRATVGGADVAFPRYWYPPKILRNQYGRCFRWSIRDEVERMAVAQPPEAVLGYWAHPDGEAAVRVGRMLKVPSGIIIGGSDVLLLTKNRSRRRQIVSALTGANLILTVNCHLGEKVVELGVKPENVRVWERGVDQAVFTPGDKHEARRRLGLAPQEPTFLWVGRLVPVKGLEVLMEACSILRTRGSTFKVHLIGEGPLRAALQADVASRGLEDSIHFVGRQMPEQLGNWYRAADLTVLPSWSEGLPNVLRESAACATPFVASRVGGIPEIAGPADRLFPPGDAAGMADAIEASLAARSEPCRSRSLSWQESADSLVRILQPFLPRVPRHAALLPRAASGFKGFGAESSGRVGSLN
jgi:teichuronic acid biosynthesis glycosyltransferase TuaC